MLEGCDPAAVLEAVTHRYPDGCLGCSDVDLALLPGELVSLVGDNGSGKTTAAKHLNGLLQPTRGRVALFGRQWSGKELARLRRRVGFVFQNPDRQLFGSTGTEELAFGPRLQGLAPQVVQARVSRSLAAVGLSWAGQTHPQRLSRGERRLLALASVLACEPEILVADEPTGGLDMQTAEAVRGLLARLARGGALVLAATHDLRLARASDRVCRMVDGTLQP
jgi:energy-coupling factor transport system ATP-binding protein